MNATPQITSTGRWINIFAGDDETPDAIKAHDYGVDVAIAAGLFRRGGPPMTAAEVTDYGAKALIAAALAEADEAKELLQSMFRRPDEMEDGDIRFLVKDFLPEGIIYFGTLPSHGKSWIAASLAKALCTGEPFLGKFPVLEPKTPVLYMTPEASSRAFKKRLRDLKVVGAGITNFHIYTMTEGPTLSLSDPRLIKIVKQIKPVIVLDTRSRFANDEDDENSASQTKMFDEALVTLRRAGAPAIVILHHSPKSFLSADISLETCLRGSGAIGAIADTAWAFRKKLSLADDGNGPVEIDVVNIKPRDFDPKPFVVSLRHRSGDKIISTIEETGDIQVVEEAAEKIEVSSALTRILLVNPKITLRSLAAELSAATSRKFDKDRIARLAHKHGWSKATGTWVHGNPVQAAPAEPEKPLKPQGELALKETSNAR